MAAPAAAARGGPCRGARSEVDADRAGPLTRRTPAARRGRDRRSAAHRRTCSSSSPSARAATRSSSAISCARPPGGGDELPDSLEAAAMARIDRLAPGGPHAHAPRVRPRRQLPPALPAGVLGDDVPPPDARHGRGSSDSSRPTATATCASAAQSSATPPTPACRTARAGACMRRAERMELEYGSMLDEVGGMLSLHFHRAGEHERACYARVARRTRAIGTCAFAAGRRPLPVARSTPRAARDVPPASARALLGGARRRARAPAS